MLYQTITAAVNPINPELSAAEVHGMASGMLCSNNLVNNQAWLQEIFQGARPGNSNAETVLENLFEDTRNLLANEEFSFNLLLPDEDSALNLQLEALREWCQGFLYGLALNGLDSGYPDDFPEIIKDVTEFTKLDSEVTGDDADNDFMEIVEYIRAAVIYLNAEMNVVNNGTIH